MVDLLLKSDIDQNENHILRPSTITIAKKLKTLIQQDELIMAYLKGTGFEKLKQQYQNDVELEYHVDQLKAAVLSEAKWNSDEDDVSKPRLFERHMSKNIKRHPSFYNNNLYYLVILSTEEKWCKETHRYHFEALNGIHHWEDRKIDFFQAEMSNRSEGKVYSNLKIKSVVRIVELTKRYHSQCLTYKGVVYLDQHNVKSFMKFNEVKKFCDGTLMKIRNNLIDMVNMNKLGKGNRRLKGKDWTDNDVIKSNEMVKKID
ncbi:hypothetical protein Tco_1193758 [Tanacetum coccineum]